MGKKSAKRRNTSAFSASALLGTPERFAQWSASDPAFAAWWLGTDTDAESVSALTVLGLSAALRACMIISGTIASLPLRTYERHGDDRHRIESVFDDPYAGVDGMTPFEWIETVLLHDVLWRNAYLWHLDRDGDGFISAYQPLYPEVITKVERVDGRKRFSYNQGGETKTVGSDWITHIPGPSVDGVMGFSILRACRRIFSGAISGDKAASTTLRQGIRLAGLLTPAQGVDIEQTEGEEILKQLRPSLLGEENAGSIAFINRDLKLEKWAPTNVESQWHETRTEILGEIGRIFGVPPHLLGDTEKQTSWGTGVAEQNLGLARYTLMPWSSRVEQRLSQRLPRGQFVEFDYKGLLQGTPAEEIALLLKQKIGGIIDVDEVRKILNLPPLTTAQKVALAPPFPVADPPVQLPAVAASRVEEPSRSEDVARYAVIQRLGEDRLERGLERGFDGILAALERQEPTRAPDIHVDATTRVEAGAVQVAPADVHVDAPTTIEAGAFTVEPTQVTIADGAVQVTTPDIRVDATTTVAEGAVHIEPTTVTIEEGAVQVATPAVKVDATIEAPDPTRTVIDRLDPDDPKSPIVGSHEEPV